MKNSIRTLTIMFLTMIFAVGCNTIDGVGKDVERGGEHIQNAAEEVKEEL